MLVGVKVAATPARSGRSPERDRTGRSTMHLHHSPRLPQMSRTLLPPRASTPSVRPPARPPRPHTSKRCRAPSVPEMLQVDPGVGREQAYFVSDGDLSLAHDVREYAASPVRLEGILQPRLRLVHSPARLRLAGDLEVRAADGEGVTAPLLQIDATDQQVRPTSLGRDGRAQLRLRISPGLQRDHGDLSPSSPVEVSYEAPVIRTSAGNRLHFRTPARLEPESLQASDLNGFSICQTAPSSPRYVASSASSSASSSRRSTR